MHLNLQSHSEARRAKGARAEHHGEENMVTPLCMPKGPVLRDHIAGSAQLSEVSSYLKLTADQELGFDWIAGFSQVNLS